TICTVIGAVGYGKSSLFSELRARISNAFPLARVLEIRAIEPLEGESDAVDRQIFVRLLNLEGQQAPSDAGKALVEDALGPQPGADLWPVVALKLGWLTTQAKELRQFAVAPSALRSMATRSLGGLIRKCANDTPLAVLIDDAQFLNEATLDALEY